MRLVQLFAASLVLAAFGMLAAWLSQSPVVSAQETPSKPANAPPVAKLVDDLQGRWQALSQEFNGVRIAGRHPKLDGMEFTVKGQLFTFGTRTFDAQLKFSDLKQHTGKLYWPIVPKKVDAAKLALKQPDEKEGAEPPTPNIVTMYYYPSPMRMRLEYDDFPGDANAGKTREVIAKLEDDTLTMCFGWSHGLAPKEFTADYGDGQTLYTFKRVPPVKAK